MERFWLLGLGLLLAGCASVSGGPTPVFEVSDPELMKDCQLVGSVKGPISKRMWGTPYTGNFKNEALKKAEQLGATHILNRVESDHLDFRDVVEMYKCPQQEEERPRSTEPTE